MGIFIRWYSFLFLVSDYVTLAYRELGRYEAFAMIYTAKNKSFWNTLQIVPYSTVSYPFAKRGASLRDRRAQH